MEPLAILGRKYPDVVIPLINSADSTIDIVVFDWRVYMGDSAGAIQDFNNAIFSAIERGVVVRALVNNDSVRAYLQQRGVVVKNYVSFKLLHTKMMIVDSNKIILGSHNYTQNAFTMNEEVSVYFKLSSKKNDFLDYFNRLWPL